MEDNSATAQIMRSGQFPTLRHVQRTHRVDVAWLHQQLEQKHSLLRDCSTAHMAADIFTKSFDDKKVGEWERSLLLIGHFRPDDKYLPCLVDGGALSGGFGGSGGSNKTARQT